MSKENRILVNEGPVTIMLNSRHPDPEKTELVLKGVCNLIAGVDVAQDWDKFTELMRGVSVVLRDRVRLLR